MSFPLAALIGVLFATVIGVLLALAAMRLLLEFLVLITLALGQVVIGLITVLQRAGWHIRDHHRHPGRILFWPGAGQLLRSGCGHCLSSWLLTFLVCWRTGESPFGRILKGIREDERATLALGKNIFTAKVIVFAITSAMAALAGTLYSGYFQLAKPQAFEFGVSIAIFTMVVVGGQANLVGSLLGAVIITMAEPLFERALNLSPERAGIVRMILYGGLLVMVVMLRPQGLLPEGVGMPRFGKRKTGRASSGAGVGSGRDPAVMEPARRRPVVLSTSGLSKRFRWHRRRRGSDHGTACRSDHGARGPERRGQDDRLQSAHRLPASRLGFGPSAGQGDRWRELRTPSRALGVVRSFQDVRLFARLTCLQNVMMAVPGQRGERFTRLWYPSGRHEGG